MLILFFGMLSSRHTTVLTIAFTCYNWNLISGFSFDGFLKNHLQRARKFSSVSRTPTPRSLKSSYGLLSSIRVDDPENRSELKPCFYKAGDRWKQRILLEDLRVGQKLTGVKIEGADLLDGKTGPKSKLSKWDSLSSHFSIQLSSFNFNHFLYQSF